MTTALDRMSDSWWESYVDECSCGVPGVACQQLHVAVEACEIDRLVAQGRIKR